ncbi:hypothetical protein MPTK1_6g01540 [Marchantia polymorpha subsp. ruderalis]|uniref:Uncharacterized protein n=2 Tax=Marchantia polymorpha TaxID=3197 RepID=A0AAF6BMF6_MARPO|nr:hypothetical protein MARPO_0052s0050 [Marchantia polymorpha]BBN13190.1 hypothetical protein Mp_6g01540 [Marchantia polymorpha subsp. ruderalis]|eukprot:PTQ38257.1 hypothetical protein MARPO_0052s0050 [Marchantia polymorpha]
MKTVEMIILGFSVTCVLVAVCLTIWFIIVRFCIDRRVAAAARNESAEKHGGGSAGSNLTRQNGRGKSDLESGAGNHHLHGGS